MKCKTVVLILAALIQLAFASVEDSVPNLYEPRLMVFTSGQPSVLGWSKLADMGVRTVINVLPERECVPGEPSIVNSYRMEYVGLPFEPEDLTMATVREFAYLLNTMERPMLIHCSTGNHVGGLWFAYRILIEKATLPEALAEGRAIGMKPAMEHAVLQWITAQSWTASQTP